MTDCSSNFSQLSAKLSWIPLPKPLLAEQHGNFSLPLLARRPASQSIPSIPGMWGGIRMALHVPACLTQQHSAATWFGRVVQAHAQRFEHSTHGQSEPGRSIAGLFLQLGDLLHQVQPGCTREPTCQSPACLTGGDALK